MPKAMTDCEIPINEYTALLLQRLGSADWLERKLAELEQMEERQHQLRLRVIRLRGALNRAGLACTVRLVWLCVGLLFAGYLLGYRWHDTKALPLGAWLVLLLIGLGLAAVGLYQEHVGLRDIRCTLTNNPDLDN